MTGINGDYYLNTISGNIFQKVSGTWVLIGNLKGPAGPLISASKVRAYQNSVQNIPVSSWTKVNLQTVMFDSLSEFNSNRFTAKNAGFYYAIGSVAVNSKSKPDYFYVAIYKNGSNFSSNYVDSLAYPELQVSTLVYLNTGDYIELYTYSSVAVPLYALNNCTYLCVSRAL